MGGHNTSQRKIIVIIFFINLLKNFIILLKFFIRGAFLKAIGYIIPLMDSDHSLEYTKEVMDILKREFSTPEDEMKKIVLKVVKQCVGCSGVDAAFVKDEVINEFFRNFWVRRMAGDKRNYK